MSHGAQKVGRPEMVRKAQQLVRRARRCLKGAVPPFGEELHQARTALKRARALLQMVPGGRKHRRRLRDVARRIAHLRDAGVAITTFDEVVKSTDLQMTPTLKEIRARLVKRRASLEADPRTKRTMEAAHRALGRRARQLKQSTVDDPGWAQVRNEVVSSYQKARRRMAIAWRSGADGDFHEWRKAVKRHAYQMRALDSGELRRAGMRMRELDRLGDLLGDAQDMAVFEEMLRGEATTAFSHDRECKRLCQQLRRRRFELRRRARPLAQTLFAERPAEYRRLLPTSPP
jgi:CHAD domain-containing protein